MQTTEFPRPYIGQSYGPVDDRVICFAISDEHVVCRRENPDDTRRRVFTRQAFFEAFRGSGQFRGGVA